MSFFCTLSILLLGYVLAAFRGVATTGMIAWLTLCIVSLFCAVLTKRDERRERRARETLPLVLTATLGMFASYQLTSGSFQNFVQWYDIAIWALAVIAIAVVLALRSDVITLRVFRNRVFPVILTGFLMIGVKTIRDSPHPHIDVFLLQQAGAEAITHLQNPYTATIPDIYGRSSPFYVDFVENGRTLYGFCYPPLVLFMELPSYLLTGDVRYTHLFALLLASVLIAAMRSSWFSFAAAILLLVNPMSLALVEFGWIEPLILLLFCALVFAATRYPKAVPWLLGLFLASKQTNLGILPLVPLLLNGSWALRSILRVCLITSTVIALSYLPFVFWNPHALLFSLVTLQVSVPLRLDLISYPAYFVKRGWPTFPIWLPFFYLPLGALFCWLKAPRTPVGFAWGTALLMVPFFALSKQGSPNYYFFALGALCCAVALTEGEPSVRSEVAVLGRETRLSQSESC
jgi:hypothetical protein